VGKRLPAKDTGTGSKKGKPPERFPWMLLVLLIGSLVIFWGLPYQLGTRTLDVDFDDRTRISK
jgi:hypothetical protein